MPAKESWMNEENKSRFVVELPYGYIQTLDRYLERIGVSRTEWLRQTIELVWNLEIELYRCDTLWDRIQESQLRILEIQAKRKRAQIEMIQEAFSDDKNGTKNGSKATDSKE